MFFLCDYCSDYISDDCDYIQCECGHHWCSIRCAKYHGYVDRKRHSYCNFCTDKDDTCSLFNLRHFLIGLVNDIENNKS